jgi:hypothetical protein
MAVLTGQARLRRIEEGRELQRTMLEQELSYDAAAQLWGIKRNEVHNEIKGSNKPMRRVVKHWLAGHRRHDAD